MIGVIGLGFVGLTTALGFAVRTGQPVYGCEADAARRQALLAGQVPFHEPGLPEALRDTLGRNFHITADAKVLAESARVIFLCVGTPCDEEARADLSILCAAVEQLLPHLGKAGEGAPFTTLVVKSTVPPGTVTEVLAPLLRAHGFEPGADIGLCNNPEFLREGYSWEDFIHPDRIVIGEYDTRSGDAVAALYEPFGAPIHRVSANTGEFIKYLSNTLLSTLISWSNDMSMLADAVDGIETARAFRILHEDRRWQGGATGKPAGMAAYAFPGCGFGGYCLPKDTQALLTRGRDAGYEAKVLDAVLQTNEQIKAHVAKKIIIAAKEAGEPRVAVLGLSFKPESDDVRCSPAADILRMLLDAGLQVTAYDPLANEAFAQMYKVDIQYGKDVAATCAASSVVAILTGWRQFAQQQELLGGKCVVDGRYLLGG